MLDTRTGGVLAMAAAPGVPPSGYRAGNAEEWRLRAITDLYEPGSTFKLVTFMAALQEGVITPDTRFRVPYRYHKYTRLDPDAHYTRPRTGVRGRSSALLELGTIMIADKKLGEYELDLRRSAARLRQAHG